jgi:hypothetical protein
MTPGQRGRIVQAIPAFRRRRKVAQLERMLAPRLPAMPRPPRAWQRAWLVASRYTSHMRVTPTRRQRKARARMARIVVRLGGRA